ncbi:MAG: carboxypeptidase-like regulatory domain-containing protein [Sphingobacteriales bacterium]|nr:MAG: carboxypeptidase-like regulatory domain-containing protein [Sphingobacteriales bacterium]
MFSDKCFRGFFGLILLLAMTLSGVSAASAQTVVKGRVIDKAGEPLPFVNIVILPGGTRGTNSNAEGYYEIQSNEPIKQLQFSLIGFKTITQKIQGQARINVVMETESRTLLELVIKPKKAKYRNKDNPAVELIKQVIDNKEKNNGGNYDYLEYEQYEKIEMALTNTPEKLKKNRLIKSFSYIAKNIDTTTLEGKGILPMYLQENIYQKYYRKQPEKEKTVIVADQKVNFGSYLDNAGIKTYMKHLYQDVNIYNSNITVVTNQFLSPIADLSPTFYQFYIVDTTIEQGERLVALSFYPRNKADMLFQGRIYVNLDNNYAIQKVNMTVNKDINLNWVRDLDIVAEYTKGPGNKYFLTKSDIRADFGLTKKGTSGLYGQRVLSNKNFLVNNARLDTFYIGESIVKLDDAEKKDYSYWQTQRHDTLSAAEARTYGAIDSLANSKKFKRIADIVTIFLSGYKRIGPNIEMGPANTFYSYNPVEGFRLRFGGRTTTDFSKRYMFETYGAYGFKDQRWKYYIGGTYSLTERSIFEFPVRAIRANYQQEVKIPGQELQFIQEDNVFLSIKRGVNDKWLYNNILNVDYLHEFRNHFSFRTGFKNWKQEAAGGLSYMRPEATTGQLQKVNSITTSELSLELRWAPNETFYQGKKYRVPMPNKYPVFTLRTIAGVKGLMNGEYTYQNVSLNIYKRVLLSQLGYSDVVMESGYVFGKVPYPLLAIHRANQTYSLQLQSYNLMNFLEFVSDHHASLIVDHCFNGFFFNKVPLLKKARLREFVNAKVLYGGMRKENLPGNDPELLQFPTFASGMPATGVLNDGPYVEGSVGIGNILNFFRIDVVKRFTYLNNPEISTIGIRGRFKFDF